MRLAIIISCDDNYVPKAIIAIQSFKFYNPDYDAYIFGTTFTPQSFDLATSYDITLIELNLKSDFINYNSNPYPIECFYHFIAHKWLPEYDYIITTEPDIYFNRTIDFELLNSTKYVSTSYHPNHLNFKYTPIVRDIHIFQQALDLDLNLDLNLDHIYNFRPLSGVRIYNVKNLHKIDFYDKIVDIYTKCLKFRPIQGDDGLQILFSIFYPEYIETISPYLMITYVDGMDLFQDKIYSFHFGGYNLKYWDARPPRSDLEGLFRSKMIDFIHRYFDDDYIQKYIPSIYPIQYIESTTSQKFNIDVEVIKDMDITICNHSDPNINGLYKMDRSNKYKNVIDPKTHIYIKDSIHHLYRFNGVWRLGNHGKSIYYKLNVKQNQDLSNVKTIDFKNINTKPKPRSISSPKSNNSTNSTNFTINLGIFIYTNRYDALSSSNVGDWIQSLSTINIYKKFIESINNTIYDFEVFLNSVINNSIPNFRFVFIKRDNLDDISQYEGLSNIITIFNGWFIHACDKSGRIEFDIPSNIKPIFLSMHISNDKLLHPQHIKTFKKFEPIGCRDKSTVDKLKQHKVKAFFTGCLTTTIDFLKWDRFNSNSNVYIVDTKIDNLELSKGIGIRDQDYDDYLSGKTLSYPIHPIDIDAIKIQNISHVKSIYHNSGINGLNMAFDLLKMYVQSNGVITSRLHCYLPCIAMGVPVDFRSPSGERNIKSWCSPNRFDGLRDLNELPKLNAIRSKLKNLAISRLTDEIFKLKFEHQITQIKSTQLIPICFCSDSNLINFIPTVINSILFKNSNIKVYYIHDIQDSSKLQPLIKYMSKLKIPFRPIYQTWNYEYMGLKHVTSATMLRLFIPQLILEPKIIYLDIDIIVNADLSNLLNINTGDMGIALKNSINPQWMQMGNSPKSGNAGVMVMDLTKLRELNFTKKCLEIHKQNPNQHDQWIINNWLNGEYSVIPSNYNIFINQDDRILKMHPDYILHYAGKAKPYYHNSPNYQYLWDYFEINI